MITRVQPSPIPLVQRAPTTKAPKRALVYLCGVLLLAATYYAAAKVGQTLRYTASVAAMWPPAGVGIAALYLWGLRWWPGVLIGELVVNAELHLGDPALPLGSLLGQQTGNMAEIIVGAALLTRLAGRRAALDRVDQVLGMLIALAVAAAISATAGTASMLAGGIVAGSDVLTFWRTWWLGDSRARWSWSRWRSRGAGAGRRVAAAANARGRPDGRRGDRARRARGHDRGAGHLPGLPGADLGGVPVRPAGRGAGDRDRRGCSRSGSPPPRPGRSSSSRSTTARWARSSTSS